jgi:hypothetical protein
MRHNGRAAGHACCVRMLASVARFHKGRTANDRKAGFTPHPFVVE